MQLRMFSLDNKYDLVRKLGKGGFGQVWLAKDVVIGSHQVAIKQILSTLDDDAGRLLIEEMETLASLDHPHIVKFLHHAKDADEFFLVMEYCAGGNLATFAGGRALDPAKVFAWGKTLTDTLSVVHQHGIVYHDIKPHNLLLTGDERTKAGHGDPS